MYRPLRYFELISIHVVGVRILNDVVNNYFLLSPDKIKRDDVQKNYKLGILVFFITFEHFFSESMQGRSLYYRLIKIIRRINYQEPRNKSNQTTNHY